MRIPAIPRSATRLLRPAVPRSLPRYTRWTSTAVQTQETATPIPAAAAAAPPRLVHELEGVYDILEGQVGGEEAWSARVQRAIREVQLDQPLRLGVYSDSPPGVPSAAGNVVTSLLLDPFTEDEPTTRAIQQRHAEPHAGDEFVIRHSTNLTREIDSLAVDSPWLRDAQVDIIEVVSSSPQDALSTLLATDITLLVLDPLRLLTPHLGALVTELAGKPHVQLVIDGTLPGQSSTGVPAARERVLQRLQDQWTHLFRHEPRPPVPQTVFLDSESGIQAIHALQRAIRTPQSTTDTHPNRRFEEFQIAYRASNLGNVTASLLTTLQSLHPHDPVARSPTRRATAHHVRDRGIAYVRGVLGSLADQSRRVYLEAEELRAVAASEAGEIARHSAARRGVIQAELLGAREAVEGVLKGFNGWKFGRRVDMVGDEVGRVVDAQWGSTLAHQLAFESGRLEQIHHRVSAHTDKVLKSHAPAHGAATPAPFFSPILMNQLSQLELDARVTPTTLLHPVQARRAQLLTSSVPALQQRAMTASLTAWSTTFLSASASWTACVPLELVSGPTATALGLLGTTASLRWAVGRWARAQRRFWQDWERVERGLEDDLARDLEDVVKGRVVRKAVVGAEGLEALAKRRMERVDAVEEALTRVTGGV